MPAGTLTPFRVSIAAINTSQMGLSYPITAGYTYTVEYRTNLVTDSWQAVAGGPHNSGTLTVTNSTPRTFYRVNAAKSP